MRGKELMPREVEASLTLGGAADLEGIVVIFSRVTRSLSRGKKQIDECVC